MENLFRRARAMASFWFFSYFYKLAYVVLFIVLVKETELMNQYDIFPLLMIGGIFPYVLMWIYKFFANFKFHSWVKMQHGLFVFRGYKSNDDDFIDIYWLRRDAFIVCFLEILFGLLPILPIDLIFKIRFRCKLGRIKKRLFPKVTAKVENEDEGEEDEEYDEAPMFSGNVPAGESSEKFY